MRKNVMVLVLGLMMLSVHAQENVHQEFARRIVTIEKEMAEYRAMGVQANENPMFTLESKAWWLSSYSYLTTYINRSFRTAPDPKLAARAYFVRAILLGDFGKMFPGNDTIRVAFPLIFPHPCQEAANNFSVFPELTKLAEKDIDIYLQYHPKDKNALAFKHYLGDTFRRAYGPED